ncbi:MAG TPA: YggS family pyridoxal phosphate-dependent enzyme [Dehalococcoidia bacterium]|nr:YggS family pyridoxal phosphate-dependent enzyme [Dehalococcoidia bacterium]
MRVSTIAERVEAVRLQIAAACQRSGRSPEEVTIVAVTKGFPPEAVREWFAAGLSHFGENRVQEAQAKLPLLADLTPRPTWHMVGHLQTNKVKTVLGLFDIIQSVDSLHLAQEISRRAPQSVRVPVLLEVNVGGEVTKYGFAPDDLPAAAGQVRALPGLEVRGLMTVAPVAGDPQEARPVFRRLRELGASLGLRELSMGMSDDFQVAVEEGATIVRIGRAIFGERSQ